MIFDPSEVFNAFLGGLLIGASASLMLVLKGRVTGISGILAGLLTFKLTDYWKMYFVLGLFSGGALILFLRPESFSIALNTPVWRVILAGLLVGFGTRLGSGCTSGHGVCGVSRLSTRSLWATGTFMFFGIATVFIFGVS